MLINYFRLVWCGLDVGRRFFVRLMELALLACVLMPRFIRLCNKKSHMNKYSYGLQNGRDLTGVLLSYVDPFDTC
jgi:hypothetical protein